MDNNLILLIVVVAVMAVVILAIQPWKTNSGVSEQPAPKKVIKRVVKIEKISTPVTPAVEGTVVNSGDTTSPVLSTSPESMTVPQLRELAKTKGISGYSSMNKSELISKLSEVK
jgi:hypothetical protein